MDTNTKQQFTVNFVDNNGIEKTAVFETKTDSDHYILALCDMRAYRLTKRIAEKRPELRSRAIRAAHIWMDGMIAQFIKAPGRYSVTTENHSDDTFNTYTVYLNGTHTCSCPDFTKGNAPDGYCKHIMAAQMQKKYGNYDDQKGDDFVPLAVTQA